MITDEILYQRYDELRECLLRLERLFQAEKEKEAAPFHDPQGCIQMTVSHATLTRGRIVGILDCIIILRNELTRLGLIDDEDAKMVDQGQRVAPQSQ